MKKQYPYSHDTEFLSKINTFHVQEQWVKITLLEYNSEIPLKDIEGKVINGNITKSGDSSVRHTCNLTCAIDTFTYNLEDIKSDYSISKKIYLELGVSNNTNEYINEKILWFPQGIFFITNFAITASSTGAASISLQFKDKMAQLDGTVGGVLPATVRFDTVTTIINDVISTKKALVYDIIMETVNHFGNEDLSNIIIDDIPTKAKRIIRWMGSESVWIYPVSNNKKISYDICFTSDLDEKQSAHNPIGYNDKYLGAKEYKTNQDIGYVYEDFVYDDELTFNAGAKVTDVLDKIKNWLGNYEYFYDEYGQFHFQEIKNYLNNSQSSYIWDKFVGTDDLDYLYESMQGKSIYTFDDNINLISITNTPVYENIKNDFIVEGTVTNNGIEHVCRYHLVIDEKPTITTEGYNNILIYTDPITGATNITSPKIIEPVKINNQWTWVLPETAEDGKIYGLLDEPQTLTYKKALKDMSDFAAYYDNFVDQENTLINQEEEFTPTEEMINYLVSLLETYMGYVDSTKYKEQYRNIIFTLARQLRRYNVSGLTPLTSTKEYYNDLYNQYSLDIDFYGTVITEKISWCGGLLQLLYDLFDNISTYQPLDDYKDENYWPAINSEIPTLWINEEEENERDPEDDEEDYLESLSTWRKERCIKYINILQNKQKQLSILIEQYNQIINEYNLQISLAERNNTNTALLFAAKEKIQNQIDNYLAQQEICGERLTLLYATLTALGSSNFVAGEIYYPIDVNISVRKTSFWYYNINENNGGYGWNEAEWYKYYCAPTESTEYYPDGLGSMTYINYSNIDWEKINNTDNYIPSMNRYSLWYQNCYIDYAAQYNLPYFDINDNSNHYIPTDWRTELLLMGLRAEENGTDPGYYYQELKANWPFVYDFKNRQLLASSIDYINYFVGKNGVITSEGFAFSDENNMSEASGPEDKAKFKIEEAEIRDYLLNYENDYYYYFFDIIDSSSSTWGEYSVNNIGRRSNVNVKEGVNCVFAPKIPDYAFINISGLTLQERRDAYEKLSDIAEEIIQVTDTFYDNFATGGFKYSAYEQIKYDLQQYTSYQNVVTITAVPCFYLEPNTRVTLNDHSTNTYGDYIIKSVSIPLGAGNNMSVNLSKAFERI